MDALIIDDREVKIELLYTEEKFPMLQKLLSEWVRICRDFNCEFYLNDRMPFQYNVDVVVTESDGSSNGDDNYSKFVMPYVPPLERRSIAFPKLSSTVGGSSEGNRVKFIETPIQFQSSNEFISSSPYSLIHDDNTPSESSKGSSVQIVEKQPESDDVNEDGALNLCTRDKFTDGNTQQDVTRPKKSMASTDSLPTKKEDAKIEQFAVQPAEFVKRNDAQAFVDDSTELNEMHRSAKFPKRANTAPNENDVSPREMRAHKRGGRTFTNKNSNSNGCKIDGSPSHSKKKSKNIEDEITKLPESSQSIVHPTQNIRRVEPISSSRSTNDEIRIEEVDSDDDEVSTQILVRADIHSTPFEVDNIYKKKMTHSKKGATRARKSHPSVNDDAIEPYNYDEPVRVDAQQPQMTIAKPKSARSKIPIAEAQKKRAVAEHTVPASAKERKSLPKLSQRDPIYDAPTQSFKKQSSYVCRTFAVQDIIDLDDDEESKNTLPVERRPQNPPKAKPSTARNRSKKTTRAARKTTQKKKSSVHHVNFVIGTPKPKRRQNRKSGSMNPVVSPCSEIVSMTAAAAGGRTIKKRRLFSSDAALDAIDRHDDDGDTRPIEPKQCNTTKFDEILDSTISTSAEIDDKNRSKLSTNFFKRAKKNVDKINLSVASPAIDPFDLLRMDCIDDNNKNNNIRNQQSNVTYSYRKSMTSQSDAKNKCTRATKKASRRQL